MQQEWVNVFISALNSLRRRAHDSTATINTVEAVCSRDNRRNKQRRVDRAKSEENKEGSTSLVVLQHFSRVMA